MTHKEPT